MVFGRCSGGREDIPQVGKVLFRLTFDLTDDILPGPAAGGMGVSTGIDVAGFQEPGIGRNQAVECFLILLRLSRQRLIHQIHHLTDAVVNRIKPGGIPANAAFLRLQKLLPQGDKCAEFFLP